MTRRLTFALAAAALVAAAPVARAQPGAGGPGRGGAMTQERMMTALLDGITLTADQQARVKAVRERFQPRLDSARVEMMAARRDGRQVAPERVQAVRALQTEQRAALRTVLTPEQQARFDRNVAAMPQGRGMRGGGRPPRG